MVGQVDYSCTYCEVNCSNETDPLSLALSPPNTPVFIQYLVGDEDRGKGANEFDGQVL